MWAVMDRVAQLDGQLGACSPAERARCHFDLVITSVLLDAGAGEHWHYHEPQSGQTYSRSEGLAVASFDAFCTGLFSSRGDYPWQADARGLQGITEAALADAFQVTAANPLVGLDGRAALLRALGTVVEGDATVFWHRRARVWAICSTTLSAQTPGRGVAGTRDFARRDRESRSYLARAPHAWVESISAMSGITVRLPAQALPPASSPSTSCHNG